jgi:hypothetical protein
MVNPIGGFSTNPWSPAFDDDEDARRRAATATGAAPRRAPEPPERPDVQGPVLARVAREAAHPGPRSAPAVAVHAQKALTDAEVRQRLDAFLLRASPVYRVFTGDGAGVDVAVATPFRMAGPTTAADPTNEALVRYAAVEARVAHHGRELRALAKSVGVPESEIDPITHGRGSPRDVQALTEALILANKLPPAEPGMSPELRVRRMMADYGIGYDCAGYVQQAFLAAHDLTRAQALFYPIVNEDLSNLSTRIPSAFSKVDPEYSRPGDIMALAPPPGDSSGHRLIVVDRHDASPLEMKRYCSTGVGAMVGGRVSVLTVDSSFGSNGNPEWGGVQRETWLYDAETKRWGRVTPAQVEIVGGEVNVLVPERVTFASMPYDGRHALKGVFHLKGAN